MTRLSSERCDFGSVRLYRISTALFSAAAKRLFLIDFPAYPRIIEHSIGAKIWLRLGGTLLPGLEIRQEHPLHVIAKRHTDPQHCLKVVAPRARHKLALVGGMGDLVQVAADAPKLTKGALERQ